MVSKFTINSIYTDIHYSWADYEYDFGMIIDQPSLTGSVLVWVIWCWKLESQIT